MSSNMGLKIHFSTRLLKVGQNLLSLPYRFCGPWFGTASVSLQFEFCCLKVWIMCLMTAWDCFIWLAFHRTFQLFSVLLLPGLTPTIVTRRVSPHYFILALYCITVILNGAFFVLSSIYLNSFLCNTTSIMDVWTVCCILSLLDFYFWDLEMVLKCYECCYCCCHQIFKNFRRLCQFETDND